LPLRSPTLAPATHTNAALLGEGAVVVVDPGSAWEDALGALWAALEARFARGERLVGAALTHHHPDHCAGVEALAAWWFARAGAPLTVWAHPETLALTPAWPHTRRAALGEGDRLPLEGQEVEALWTPGHAPGHLALWEAAQGALCAGDLVASTGTIIVNPPRGDMGAYLRSLRRALALPGLRLLLPAHGAPLRGEDAVAVLERTLAHRLAREALVRGALTEAAQAVEALLPAAYPELSPSLYPLAARSLLAHLVHLEGEGAAAREGERWRRA
jgi:glyoxylase-like metal-dependent hydrolase (beta-lactamase superfamily II)